MKLKLNKKICYLIGLCNRNQNSLLISTEYNEVLEKFIQIAINNLNIKPEKIIINKKESRITAFSYNSKIKIFFNQILGKRDNVFKYINDYSSNYFAGLFDNNGFISNNDLYFKNIDMNDQLILEKFNIHVNKTKNYYKIISKNQFLILIKQNSIKINFFFKKENK